VSPGVWKKAQEAGTVRVIVDLDVPAQSERNLDQNGRKLQRQAIAEAQNKLLMELVGTKHEGGSRLTTVPAIGLRVGADALELLERSALVKKVTEDRMLDPHMKTYSQTPFAKAKSVLKPYPDELMDAHDVSPIVNSAKYDGPDCIQPVQMTKYLAEGSCPLL
jgi:hypothetical protein